MIHILNHILRISFLLREKRCSSLNFLSPLSDLWTKHLFHLRFPLNFVFFFFLMLKINSVFVKPFKNCLLIVLHLQPSRIVQWPTTCASIFLLVHQGGRASLSSMRVLSVILREVVLYLLLFDWLLIQIRYHFFKRPLLSLLGTFVTELRRECQCLTLFQFFLGFPLLQLFLSICFLVIHLLDMLILTRMEPRRTRFKVVCPLRRVSSVRMNVNILVMLELILKLIAIGRRAYIK